MMRVRPARSVRFVSPIGASRFVGDSAAEGETGFVTPADLVDRTAPGGIIDPGGRLDERAEQLRHAAARYQELVEQAQEAFASATRLATALRRLEAIELREGLSWASADERERIQTARAAVDLVLGKGADTSPVPAFSRHLPAKYWAYEFIRESGISAEEAADAVGISESAYRKAWHDYDSRKRPDLCTWCGRSRYSIDEICSCQ